MTCIARSSLVPSQQFAEAWDINGWINDREPSLPNCQAVRYNSDQIAYRQDFWQNQKLVTDTVTRLALPILRKASSVTPQNPPPDGETRTWSSAQNRSRERARFGIGMFGAHDAYVALVEKKLGVKSRHCRIGVDERYINIASFHLYVKQLVIDR